MNTAKAQQRRSTFFAPDKPHTSPVRLAAADDPAVQSPVRLLHAQLERGHVGHRGLQNAGTERGWPLPACVALWLGVSGLLWWAAIAAVYALISL